jgi:hypothetical protein
MCQTFSKELKPLGIWDLEVEQVSSTLIMEKLTPGTEKHEENRVWVEGYSAFFYSTSVYKLPKAI